MWSKMRRPIFNRRQVTNLPYRVVAVALFLGAGHAQGLKQVAITIDDLPHAGSGVFSTFPELQRFTKAFLEPLERAHVPFIGFVNEHGRGNFTPAELRSVLDMWLDSGGDLGNHTATHPDLNRISLEKYEQDILAGEAVTRAVLEERGRKLRYFRHPFLHAGQDIETKRHLEQWLSAHGYTVAPVTLDNSDYIFASVYANRKKADGILAEYIAYMQSIVDFFDRRSIEVLGRLSANSADSRERVESRFHARATRHVSQERVHVCIARRSAERPSV
jgi:peptidoglycan/xylan/chitin deacetylase (PgdA/CDA1 family)